MYRKIHRSIGIGCFIFSLIFVITGLTIQHTSGFGLDRRYISSSLASFLYNTTIQETMNYQSDNRWFSHAATFFYIDGLPVPYIELNNLQGVVETEAYIWVVGDNKLWLLSKQGEIIEELSIVNGLPTIAKKIGRDREGSVILGGLAGNWVVDENLRDWQVYHGDRITWATPVNSLEVPMHLKEAVLAHANNHLINWQRVLLDFHSGRLFGNVGIIIADIAALLLLFLSATGVFLWIRRI